MIRNIKIVMLILALAASPALAEENVWVGGNQMFPSKDISRQCRDVR